MLHYLTPQDLSTMQQLPNSVSWTQYAAKYDMLMSYNPFYQALHQEVLDLTDRWSINMGDLILDIGAGTGNYSSAVARKFAQAEVIHIDSDNEMNSVAEKKRENQKLTNLNILQQHSDDLRFQDDSVKACLCIHFLYTQEDPIGILQRIFEWLQPGGQAIFVDPGRILNVLDWKVAIGYQMIKRYGLVKTLELMREGREVSKQNRKISKLQANGTYWTHSTENFRNTIENIGFTIDDSGQTFRKLSDWVAVTKPSI